MSSGSQAFLPSSQLSPLLVFGFQFCSSRKPCSSSQTPSPTSSLISPNPAHHPILVFHHTEKSRIIFSLNFPLYQQELAQQKFPIQSSMTEECRQWKGPLYADGYANEHLQDLWVALIPKGRGGGGISMRGPAAWLGPLNPGQCQRRKAQ